jgi:arylsulfatase
MEDYPTTKGSTNGTAFRTTDEAFWPTDPQAKAAGVRFTKNMEGRKGEKSRDLAVYDLEQRRLIDAEITRRTIDFMK